MVHVEKADGITMVLQYIIASLTVQTSLVFLLVLLVSWYFLGGWLTKTKNLPPGPNGLLAATMAHLTSAASSNPAAKIGRFRKMYRSDVTSLTAGWNRVVVLHTYDLIKQAFVKGEDFMDRPRNFVFDVVADDKGIIGTNGRVWKEQRRFALSVLRDFGMGRNMIEEKIQEEATEILRKLDELKAASIDLQYLIGTAVSNIVCSIVFGKRYDYDDTDFVRLLKLVNFGISKARVATLAYDTFPFLKYIPGDLFHIEKIKANQVEVRQFVQARIEEDKATLDPENIRSFIDAYLVEIKKREDEPDTTFTDDQLQMVISDLFLAGTETTAVTLRWAFLYMVLYPEIQVKDQQEIDDVIGRERLPAYADRTKMPYTEAVLMEIQRFGSIFPFGAPHGNVTNDVKIGGYDVPKGSNVMGNVWAVHHDPEYWPHPDTFNPDNFLDADGKVVYRERLIPFMIGKRACPGESLAKMELFIFFVAMLQKFHIRVPDGSPPPDATPIMSINLQPKPYKVSLEDRDD